jgi:glycine reductase
MRLELAYYDIRDVRFGRETRLDDQVLTIDRDELCAKLLEDERLGGMDLALAHPGERCRIVHLTDIQDARVKVSGPGEIFPGMVGGLTAPVEGRTNILRGLAVAEAAEIPGMLESVVDMSGPVAALTPLSSLHHVVLLSRPAEGVGRVPYGHALLKAGLRASVYLAEASRRLPPDAVLVSELGVGGESDSDGGLPRVAYLCQVSAIEDLREIFLYGGHARRMLPTLLHPHEVLNGAIVNGIFDTPACRRTVTYGHVNNPVVMELISRHGRDLDFVGMIITPTPPTLSEKERGAAMAAKLARYVLGAEGIVQTKGGGGHMVVDHMLACERCEELGIKTVLLNDRSVDAADIYTSERADAIVCTGASGMDQSVQAPAMERVIGGTTLEDGEDAREARRLPLARIQSATDLLGLGRVRAFEL